jgi:antirestriction protein ArdC
MTPQSSACVERASVYARIAADIIAAIEAANQSGQTLVWRMPWHHDGAAVHRPVNALTARPYRGINTLALWAGAQTRGYASGLWATYRQWADLGAQVRRGERATLGIVWKPRAGSARDDAEGDDDQPTQRLLARAFFLFNLDQTEGYTPPAAGRAPDPARIPHAEAFIANLGIAIRRGADGAWYQPHEDVVHMPDFGRFRDADAELAVRLHECAHASGAPHRLNRDLTGRFGSAAYAMEECIADLAASFVLADLAIAHRPRPDHAAYLQSWLAVLQDDPRAIVTAAAKAQAIADWMAAQQHPEPPP